jgi:hypothetical protein
MRYFRSADQDTGPNPERISGQFTGCTFSNAIWRRISVFDTCYTPERLFVDMIDLLCLTVLPQGEKEWSSQLDRFN